ncbi:MAG: protein translocase subunit SecD [Candidatus Paceibacterota bacterium]
MNLKFSHKIIIVILLAVVAGALVFPKQVNKGIDASGLSTFGVPHVPEVPFHFGLDLEGGSRLIYKADVSGIPKSEQPSAVEGARGVIQRRVNAFGVSEARVLTKQAGNQWRLVVELPNVDNLDKALKWIGETPRLEFKEKKEIELTEEQRQNMESYNQEAREKAEEILDKTSTTSLSELANQYSGTTTQFMSSYWVTKDGNVPQELNTALFEEMEQNETKLVETEQAFMVVTKSDQRTLQGTEQVNASYLSVKKKTRQDLVGKQQQWQNTKLGGEELKDARVNVDQTTGEPKVVLEFNKEGSDLFAKITERNVGEPLAVFLDGKSIVDTNGDGKIDENDTYAPVIQQKITGGQAVITGDMTTERAQQIAERLKAGALPVPIEMLYQRTVGATLGQNSLQKSLRAGLFGLAAIVIFMILVYRLPGLLASLSLATYGVILLTLFKLIPVTLSMAGIGGAILSIGMAIDANILIFSRFKEELRKDKSFSVSLIEGFRRAWPSIRDGNLTTLIAAFILFTFGTSFVKGFALTLGIGILVSIFAAMFITKTLLQAFRNTRLKEWSWLWP